MRFGSLFSGIGGFDLGFERAGMECAWQCEIDPKAQDVLRKHWGVKIYDDVRTITKDAEPVDLICGGFPCQDVSIAGKRKGLAGERSGLWFEFARIIDELEPKWVVIENVPGLLSSNRGQDFAVIVQWLANRGYGVSWRILDAQYFGVPQRRRRVFIVGSLGNGDSAKVLFESEGLSGDTPQGRKAGEGIAGTLAPSLTASNDPSRSPQSSEVTQQVAAILEAQTVGALQTRDYKGISADNLDHMICNPVANTLAGGSSKCHSDITSGQQDGNLICWEMQHASEAYRESGDIAPNLQARMGTGSNNVPLVGVRRLTPTECARLQGFPDDWNDWLADSARYKQYGNAVCVNVAEWIGKRIMEVGK